ncbi:hypothetical protein [Clostridium intestinale]|uniref:DUF927 domain-containing protein n=1 Tax=Clostridium intestinale DSM 6191 TaxID=1121320 RepID=A0A1M6A4M5_9CLOT|nr:hypothetical protein [Clostridium intestinale]SHI31309.1 hypothetical protein SAMN02745941_03608 [Clostridium intestinale DSM 6191]
MIKKVKPRYLDDEKLIRKLVIFKKKLENYTKSEYTINDEGELCYIKNNEIIPLCNFVLIPQEEVKILEGDIIISKLRITCVIDNTEVIKDIEVGMKEIKKIDWIDKYFGFKCCIYSEMSENRSYEKIKQALKLCCKDLGATKIANQIGWGCDNGKYFYVHGDGIIGKKRDIEVGEELNDFRIDIYDELHPAHAYIKSFEMLDIAPLKITLPLFSYTLMSVINSLLREEHCEPQAVLWLEGETGSRKTTLARQFSFLFNRSENPPVIANFKCTKTFLEYKMNQYKDSVLVIDDYYPAMDPSEKQDMNSKVELILRLIGDKTPKGRSNVNLKESKNLTPRGLVLITGEDFTHVKSNIARCINIKVEKNDVNLDKLTEFQENPLILSTSIFYYIKWLSKYMTKNQSLPKIDLDKFRKKYSNTNIHGRLIDAIWGLKYSFYLYLKYGISINVIDKKTMKEKLEQVENVFYELVEKQSMLMVSEEPLYMYLNTLNEMIISNKIIIKKIGYKPENKNIDGWYDEKYYYMLPEGLYNTVFLFWRKRNKVFPLGQKQIHDLMRKNNIIEFEKNTGKNCKKVKVNSENRLRVLKISKEKLNEYLSQ